MIGACSKTCGGGMRTNIRELKFLAESAEELQDLHESCAGSSNITESCNIQECPGMNT